MKENRRLYHEYTWLQLSHIWQRGQIRIKEKAVFLIKRAGKTECPHKRMKLTCVSTTCTKSTTNGKKKRPECEVWNDESFKRQGRHLFEKV